MNRKLKVILIVLVIACAFTACWDAQQNRKTYTGEKTEDNSTIKLEMSAVSDQLVQLIQTTTVLLDDYDEQALKQIDQNVADTKAAYDGKDGVSYVYEYVDDSLVEIITIDMQKTDLSILQEDGILCFDGKNTDSVSVSSSMEYLKELGFSFEENRLT